VKECAGLDLVHVQWHGRLVATQHHIVNQRVDTIERGAPAKDIELIDRFPSKKGTEQTAQSEDVIEVSVCEQNVVDILKPRARLQNLSLCAFAAIHQKAIFIVFDDLC